MEIHFNPITPCALWLKGLIFAGTTFGLRKQNININLFLQKKVYAYFVSCEASVGEVRKFSKLNKKGEGGGGH